jgi:hypothetical protein
MSFICVFLSSFSLFVSLPFFLHAFYLSLSLSLTHYEVGASDKNVKNWKEKMTFISVFLSSLSLFVCLSICLAASLPFFLHSICISPSFSLSLSRDEVGASNKNLQN